MNQQILLQCFIVLLLCILPLVFLRKNIPFISLRTGSSMVFLMLFCVWPIAYMFNLDVSWEYLQIWGVSADEYFPIVLWYAIIGILLFHIFYLLPVGQQIANRFTPRRKRWNSKGVFVVCVVATVASLVSAIAIWAQLGGFSTISILFGRAKLELGGYHYLTLGITLLRASILIAWAYSITHKFPRSVIWGQVVLYSIINVTLGGRNQVVGLWLMLFVVHLLLTKETLSFGGGMSRLRKISTGALVVGVSLVLLVVIRGFRTTYDASTLGLGATIVESVGSSLVAFITPLITEFDQMEVFATIVAITPIQIPFWNGQSYLDIFTLPVPRSLWPEKPIPVRLTLGNLIRGQNVGIPMTMIGEFYINFGIFGIVSGMSLFGVMCKTLDRWAYTFRDNPSVIIFFVFVLTNLPIILTRYFYGWFGALLIFTLSLIIVLRFTRTSKSVGVRRW